MHPPDAPTNSPDRRAWVLAPAVALLAACRGPAPAAGARADTVAEGTRAWTLQAGHLGPPSDDERDVHLDSLRVGHAYRFRDGFAVAGELDVASFDGDREAGGGSSDALGLGASGLLRWHALRGASWRAYLELGLGLLATDEAFPEGGTSLNGARQVGLGAAFDLTERLSLTLGVRQQHVSNGKGLVDENPSWEGFGAYLGLQLASAPRRGAPAPARPFEPVAARPWSLRLDGRAGDIGDETGGGGVLALDGRLAGPVFGQLRASLDDVDGESLQEGGLALYARGERGLGGLAYDRQELDVFADDELTLFGEWYANDLVTVAGVLGHQQRNLSEDRVLGGAYFRLYPLEWLQVETGIVARDTPDDFGQESFDVPLGLELALPSPAGARLSLFVQDDLHDELRVAGLRLTLAGPGAGSLSLRDLHRSSGPLRRRP